MSHLPEALELPLFNPEKLAGLSADDCGVTRCVVEDGLPEGCPNAQCADSNRILHTDIFTYFLCAMETFSAVQTGISNIATETRPLMSL